MNYCVSCVADDAISKLTPCRHFKSALVQRHTGLRCRTQCDMSSSALSYKYLTRSCFFFRIDQSPPLLYKHFTDALFPNRLQLKEHGRSSQIYQQAPGQECPGHWRLVRFVPDHPLTTSTQYSNATQESATASQKPVSNSAQASQSPPPTQTASPPPFPNCNPPTHQPSPASPATPAT